MDLIFAIGNIFMGLFFMAIGFNVFNPLPKDAYDSFTPKKIRLYKFGGIFLVIAGIFLLITNL